MCIAIIAYRMFSFLVLMNESGVNRYHGEVSYGVCSIEGAGGLIPYFIPTKARMTVYCDRQQSSRAANAMKIGAARKNAAVHWEQLVYLNAISEVAGDLHQTE